MSSLQESLDKLFQLHTFGIKLGLQNVEDFLSYIQLRDYPLKFIHIAGSNGKGSTSSFIASILMEAGYKTGLYTSPHFVRFNERIKINGKEIPDDYVKEFIDKYYDYIIEHQVTFFEATTIMAVKYFSDNKIDVGVIETGLGGRLDATNILKTIGSVITSISLEHTNILGDTLSKIAYEKAGIIKHNHKTCIGFLPEDASEETRNKCSIEDAELFEIKNFYEPLKKEFNCENIHIDFNNIYIPLKGEHQFKNAALAVLAVIKNFNIVDPQIIQDGIEKVILNTGIEGRFEFYNKKPDVIFDSAHNHEGILSFINEFKSISKNYSKRILIFTALHDKSVSDMLQELKPYFDEIYLTELNIERASSKEELLEISESLNLNVKIAEDPSQMINNFIKNEKSSCLVVLGSMYLLGKIKTELPVSA